MHRFLLFFFLLANNALLAQSITWISPCVDKTFCLNPGSCTEGDVFMKEQAVTICSGGYINYSYKIDLFNDGSINIQSSEDSVDQAFPIGTHLIIWRANDNCGNVSTDCSYLFTVKDCNPPNLLCINGLTQNLEFPECEATFELQDFILNITDNCTPVNELEFGIRVFGDTTGGFPTDTALTFGICEQGLHVVEIWVRDEYGLANSCNSYVLVQENSGLCPCNIDADLKLEGCARTADDMDLDTYTIRVELEGVPPQGQPFQQPVQLSFGDSCYSVSYLDLPIDGAYSGTVSAKRLGDPLIGVSTFDLVTINKHILGQQLFSSFFQSYAADVNASKTITTFDIIEIRKLILGIYDTFPQVPSWRFILPMPDTNLIAFDAVQDTYTFDVPVLAADTVLKGFDFIGIKMGDANTNASFQSVDDRGAPLILETEDRWLEAGKPVWIPLQISSEVALDGWQLALLSNSDKVEILDIRGISSESVAFGKNDELRMSCVYDSPKVFQTSEALVYLLIEAVQPTYLSQALKLNNAALKAEAYTSEDLPIRPIELRTESEATTGISIFPPRPNPFSEKTEFNLILDTPQTVQLECFSLAGELVYATDYQLQAGNHTLSVNADKLPGSGIWMYRIVAGEEVATGRIMRF